MTGYEIIITIIQFCVRLGLTYSLYLTRREFINRNRPYIGFTDIIRKENETTNELEFDVYVSNVGSLPAKNAKLKAQFFHPPKNYQHGLSASETLIRMQF